MRRLMAIGVLLTLVWGCSTEGRGGGVGDGGAAATSCDAGCCCKLRDGYYVRYRCQEPSQCEAVAGECIAAGSPKCAS